MRDLPSSNDERLERLERLSSDLEVIGPGVAGLAEVLQEVIEYLGDRAREEEEAAQVARIAVLRQYVDDRS